MLPLFSSDSKQTGSALESGQRGPQLTDLPPQRFVFRPSRVESRVCLDHLFHGSLFPRPRHQFAMGKMFAHIDTEHFYRRSLPRNVTW